MPAISEAESKVLEELVQFWFVKIFGHEVSGVVIQPDFSQCEVTIQHVPEPKGIGCADASPYLDLIEMLCL